MPSHSAAKWMWPFIIAVLALMPGCTTVSDLAGVQRTGHQPNGTYVLGPEEESMACRQIRERLDILSARLKSLPETAAKEQDVMPRTVSSAFGRMFGGPGGGLKATAEFQRATAESEALNGLLARKQCT